MTKMTFFRRMAFFACVALTMNIFLWSCSDKTDSPEDNKTEIKLKTPEEAATIDLASGDVTFSWEVLNGTIPGFTLFISKSVDLNDAYTKSSTSTSVKISKDEMDELLGYFEVEPLTEGTIYWTVKPASENATALLPTVRSLKIKRLNNPTIVLLAPGESVDMEANPQISFEWEAVDGPSAYILKWGIERNDLKNEVSAGTASPFIASTATVAGWFADAHIDGLGKNTTIYWSIVPSVDLPGINKQIRKTTIKLPGEVTTVELTDPADGADITFLQWTNWKTISFKWNKALPAGSKLVFSKNRDISTKDIIFDIDEDDDLTPDVDESTFKNLSHKVLQEKLVEKLGVNPPNSNTLYWNVEVNGKIYPYLTRKITLNTFDPKLIYQSDFTLSENEVIKVNEGWSVENNGSEPILSELKLEEGKLVFYRNKRPSNYLDKLNFGTFRIDASKKYKFTTSYKINAENQGFWRTQLTEVMGNWAEWKWVGNEGVGVSDRDEPAGKEFSTDPVTGIITQVSYYHLEETEASISGPNPHARFSYRIGWWSDERTMEIYSLRIEEIE